MKRILVTGCAGFIGYHVAKSLLNKGDFVLGIDNMNEYYDITLKKDRLADLKNHSQNKNFHFEVLDLEDYKNLFHFMQKYEIDTVINLAAQAGVRYSLINPDAYMKSNMQGFLNILEACRHGKIKNLIYASSSSVYGKNGKLPFHEESSVDHPISLYAASKKSNELMAHAYSHLFSIPCTGLRFFTVYGPWGRPDMAMFLFADAISKGKPLTLFNNGDMWRDFTYVDDIVESIVRLCDKPASPNLSWDPQQPSLSTSSSPYQIFNIGNDSPILVKDIITIIEEFFHKKAIIHFDCLQPGDVLSTHANVDRLKSMVDFKPKTSMREGLGKFLHWFKDYYHIA